LESAGRTTVLDRDIWGVTLTSPETGPPESKPGYFLDGGTHDWELGGSQTALYTAWYLTTRYGEDPEVTELLDTRAIYIIPRKDAVGMEHQLTRRLPCDPVDLPVRFRNRCTDPPSDITGNGEILEMRYVDPHGGWVIDSGDPRIMRARGMVMRVPSTR
jgi:murein tripeptide amidase MpaA